MKLRFVIIAIILALAIVAGLTAAAWFRRPNLLDVYPPDGAGNVPVTSQLRMVFSRSMDPETVISHLTIEPVVDGIFTWDESSLILTPSTTLPGGQELSVNLAAGARAGSWLAFPMSGVSWSFTTSESFLAYLWPSDGLADIYALNPSDGGVVQYTNGMGVLEFSTSHDGLLIYFSATNAFGGADIHLLDRKMLTNLTADSYQPTQLVDCSTSQCRSPVVSPDGQYLAYEQFSAPAQGVMGPAMVRLMSLPERNVIPLGLAEHETIQPSWSSTGWLAYYDRTSQSYEIFNPQTEESIQLPNATGQPGSWSPDGEFYLAPEIYYFPAGNIETGSSHLIRYNISAGSWDDLSVQNDVEDVEGIYSPGGVAIAFVRKYLNQENWSFGRQLWIMNADGSDYHPITDEPNYNHYDLSWSRDGGKLAYVRFNQVKISDPPELWMINADGSNPVQLVIGGYSPLWIP